MRKVTYMITVTEKQVDEISKLLLTLTPPSKEEANASANKIIQQAKEDN